MLMIFYFFLANPHITVPNLMRHFEHYSYILNLKIHFAKSEAMNISLAEDTLNRARSNCPFRWVTNELKYLGIWPTTRLTSIYEHNLPKLLLEIRKDLQNWHSKYFSWFVILKMVILLRLLSFLGHFQ